jgi:hypothetical protein
MDESTSPASPGPSDESQDSASAPTFQEPVTAEPVTATAVEEEPRTNPWSDIGGAKPPRLKAGQGLPPAGWRELLALIALVAICDVTIYRGHGFAGYALLFVTAPLLLCLGSTRPQFGRPYWIVAAMLLVLAMKLVWLGSWLLVGAGFALLFALAISLAGRPPYVLAVLEFATRTVWSGFERVEVYGRRFVESDGLPRKNRQWLNVAMPAAALFVFGMIFIVANPDVLSRVSKNLELAFTSVHEWLKNFTVWEVVFWAAVAWIGLGLLRPAVDRLVLGAGIPFGEDGPSGETAPAPLFAAYRNTLATVIVLFTIYLVFEFNTLWFHTFPKGFYYSGYAHQGAAWLTFALALATLILSFIFRGRTLCDPRIVQLRRLAWVWSAQNFVLALAVYNRLGIYIGYNGMTRMRIVGIFGISAVVVGFILVLRKIAKGRSFAWLLRNHLLTVAIAVYLFALTPLDAIVCRYNVRQILAGDLKPSVQITEHPISTEGILLLRPLLDCKDPIIREGVRGMLAERDREAELLGQQREALGWTAHQMADKQALEAFRAYRADWDRLSVPAARDAYLAFKKYAYQWY